ncbi:MAG TPA: OmpA family protein [Paraburkholderia sp.]
MSINVFQLLDSVLSDDVVRSLGGRLGLTPELTRKVSSAVAPAIVAAIMNRGGTAEGAHGLFSTIMSADTNAQAGTQLPALLASSAGLGQLETYGRELLHKATGIDAGALADVAAEQTGATPAAAFSLTGVIGAVLMGLLKQHFVSTNGFAGQLPTLLGHQLSSVNASLTDRLARAVGLGSAAAFDGSILGRLKSVSDALLHPQPVARPVSEWAPPQTVGTSSPPIPVEKRSHSWLWWLLAVIVLIVAFFALRSCHHDEDAQDTQTGAQGVAQSASQAASADAASQPGTASEAVADAASQPFAAAAAEAASIAAAASAASDAAPLPTEDARFLLKVDADGQPTVTATVGSETEKALLLDALAKRFGDGKFRADVTVDAATRPAAWLAHLDDLLPLMALPGAEVKIDGTHVELGGAAADAKLGWPDRLKAAFGPDFQMSVFDVKQAVANAAQSFSDALKNLFGRGASCAAADVVPVLNLQVVNFATGSMTIPASAVDELRQSARVLHGCAKEGKPVTLEVAGYSDNVGDKDMNLALSKQRAQAVRAYLVAHGVDPATLHAEGYGEANPVDTNDTGSGRFHNRRIEFAVKP